MERQIFRDDLTVGRNDKIQFWSTKPYTLNGNILNSYFRVSFWLVGLLSFMAYQPF